MNLNVTIAELLDMEPSDYWQAIGWMAEVRNNRRMAEDAEPLAPEEAKEKAISFRKAWDARVTGLWESPY